MMKKCTDPCRPEPQVERRIHESDRQQDALRPPHRCTRRRFLAAAFIAPTPAWAATRASRSLISFSSNREAAEGAPSLQVDSPDEDVSFRLLSSDRFGLQYEIAFRGSPVIETSLLGIIVDGSALCREAEIIGRQDYAIQEAYPWRGVHSEAVNHCNGARFSLRHIQSGLSYALEVRAFNDGIGFRYLVPGDEAQRVPDEETTFAIPAGSVTWYHDFEGHYEGIHERKEFSQIGEGDWAAVPVTFQLPSELGFASIMEAALIDFPGMALRAVGPGVFASRLAHRAPVSYPFRLRYEDDIERLSKPAAIAGDLTFPWRVVTVGRDLNALVNCDILHNLSPPPDPKLFPDGMNTEWIQPGRCVWRYLDGGGNSLEDMKEFSRIAGELGFEHHLVEGFWRQWSEEDLQELIDYSRDRCVGIWLWQHSREIRNPEERRRFFEHCAKVGAAGVKLDFYDHEAKEIIDLYQESLRGAAECRLMVNFHGSNKPTGEARTWPNELTREGVYGLEYRRTEAWAEHNTTLPFTRMLAGHADYTPMHFGERRRETSWAHQIASAAILTSPLLVLAAHPATILGHPAVEAIKSIPSEWDETIALPESEIGQLAAFARRKGNMWILAIMNGPTARSIPIPLTFLDEGEHSCLLVGDRLEEAAAVKLENSRLGRKDVLEIEMRAGGGFLGRFQR